MDNEVFEDVKAKSGGELKTLDTSLGKAKKSYSETDNGSCFSAKLSKEDYKALEDKYKTVSPTTQGWYNHPSPSGHGGPSCFGILFKDYNWVVIKDFGYEWDKDELWSELEITPIPYSKRENEPGERVEYSRYNYLVDNYVIFQFKVRYRFLDENGELIRKPDGSIKKLDNWFHYNNQGNEVLGMQRDQDGNPIHILYNLPSVITTLQNGDPIWIPEGEKDADTIIQRFKCCATSGDAGRKSWRDEWVDVLTSGKTMEFVIPLILTTIKVVKDMRG